MEIPKPSLIITEWKGDTPISGMCSACRAIFPALEGKGADANKRLLEDFFRRHVKAEHPDQPPPWENAQGNQQ